MPNPSVVGIELVAPLAAVAQRAAAANGLAGVVSVVQADAGSCKRGQQVPLRGADVILLDMFDAGELAMMLGVGRSGLWQSSGGVVSVVQADAGSCKRGQQMPLRGADIMMLDIFDAGTAYLYHCERVGISACMCL
jgi:hypothetical protein